jgi:hypothetical protein
MVSISPAFGATYDHGSQFIINSGSDLFQFLEDILFLTGVSSGYAADDGGCVTNCSPASQEAQQCTGPDGGSWDNDLCNRLRATVWTLAWMTGAHDAFSAWHPCAPIPDRSKHSENRVG